MTPISHHGTSIITLNTCFKCRYAFRSFTRDFSSTPTPQLRRITKQRRGLLRWLNGPGAVFRESRTDGVNYLTAYDPSGRLKDNGGAVGTPEDDLSDEEIDSDEVSEAGTEAYQPFPMNPQFHSEPVLSEDLKEAIWHMVTQQGTSVRKVSATYEVDMRRVGAVVRLKEMEKQWVREVRHFLSSHKG